MNTPASTKVEQRHREYAAEACRFTGWKGAALSIERGNTYSAESAEQRLMELFARFEATLTPAPSGEGRGASGVLEALDQSLEQFSEPMSALNPHELGERLANDVAEIVRHARARSAMPLPTRTPAMTNATDAYERIDELKEDGSVAAMTVVGIWRDLTDRGGLGDAFESCDDETQIEIINQWFDIARRAEL